MENDKVWGLILLISVLFCHNSGCLQCILGFEFGLSPLWHISKTSPHCSQGSFLVEEHPNVSVVIRLLWRNANKLLGDLLWNNVDFFNKLWSKSVWYLKSQNNKFPDKLWSEISWSSGHRLLHHLFWPSRGSKRNPFQPLSTYNLLRPRQLQLVSL